MKTKDLALAAAAAIVTTLAPTSPAWAAQRTFVSVAGNDASACSVASPCRSLAAAMTVTGIGGEVIVLDSGGYGPVTITQSVSIIAPPGIYAGISVPAGSDGITVAAPGSTVVLRGLSINGQGGGIGIKVTQANRLRVENLVIAAMANDGVQQTAAGAELMVIDTIVRDNGGDGISLSGVSTAQIDRVRLVHNGGNGLIGESGANVTVSNSVSSGNAAAGIVAYAAASTTTHFSVTDSVLSDNATVGFKGQAAVASGCVRATVVRTSIMRSPSGIQVDSPATLADIICGVFVVSDDNVLSKNGVALDTPSPFAGLIYTRQNNTLFGNSTDVFLPPNVPALGPK